MMYLNKNPDSFMEDLRDWIEFADKTIARSRPHASVLLSLIALLICSCFVLPAQELQPRAYTPAPVGVNFFGIAYTHTGGGLLFDPSLPVTDSSVNANTANLSFGQSFAVKGRTAQVLAIVPYIFADVEGLVSGGQEYRRRSGLTDSVFRYAMNIYGAPAMHLPEFAKYEEKTVVGASVTVAAPTGQYDPNVLLNIGMNRWAFKPELGISRAFGKWRLEAAVGAWLYTPNNDFYGGNIRTQDPLGSIQTHVVRFLPRQSWISFDATFFTGGRSYVGDSVKADYQANTRFGVTYNYRIDRRQAIKVVYFRGATTRIGNDIQSIGVGYSVIWLNGR
jgi:hypothetical protein